MKVCEFWVQCTQIVPRGDVLSSVKLTIDRVEKLRPDARKAVEVFDSQEKGMFIRVAPGGTKTWGLRYRTPAGVHRRLKLGRFPDIAPDGARLLAKAARLEVSNLGDPVARKKAERLEIARSSRLETIEEVGRAYFKDAEVGKHTRSGRPKRASTINSELSYFERYIVPQLGSMRIKDLTRRVAQGFVDDVAAGRNGIKKASRSGSRQCRAILGSVCTYAIHRDFIDTNPMQLVAAHVFAARERVLTDAEVAALWAAMEGAQENKDLHVSRPICIAIEFALVTLQRRAEIAGMRRSEVDYAGKTWTIPGSRTKNGRTHRVPLSPSAVALLQEAESSAKDSEFMFPSPRGQGDDVPIDPPALSHAFRRICKAAKLKGIRLHDLRRTGASNMTSERLGIPRLIVSKVLNHTSDSGGAAEVTAVYDLNDYLPEKRKGLDGWGVLLTKLTAGAPSE